ncbi:MAG: YdiU family protein [Acetobacteraceae bacterium]
MPLNSEYRPATVHAGLGDAFYDRVEAARFPQLVLRHRDQIWAERIGLGDLTEAEWVGHFGRFEPLPGSFEQPLALRYHGHQFRTYNPDLGDGRGFLFAQVYDRQDGRLLDLGTKGSGQTPWSRFGDGRLTLKGGVREVLATSMLEALGVYTSKSLSLIETGEDLFRNDEPSPTRSAVLVRLNHSHIRIGTFQRFLTLGQPEQIGTLLDHSVRHYLPQAWREDPAERAVAFLAAVAEGVARLGAAWMVAGFVHGVLNTDNINITGESFDYGPWRFVPEYDAGFTAAYFDQSGLYAYGRQPDTLLWNLVRLAECLLPVAPKEALQPVVEGFAASFHAALDAGVVRRLGLVSAGPEADRGLAQAWWAFLEESRAPFEQAFFDWYGGVASAARAARSPSAAFYGGEAFTPVRTMLERFETAAIRLDHGYFAGGAPCTMLIDEVEALWAPIAEADDWGRYSAKLAAIGAMAEAYGVRSAVG